MKWYEKVFYATENRSVGGSTPSLGTILFKHLGGLHFGALLRFCTPHAAPSHACPHTAALA